MSDAPVSTATTSGRGRDLLRAGQSLRHLCLQQCTDNSEPSRLPQHRNTVDANKNMHKLQRIENGPPTVLTVSQVSYI